MPTETPNQSTPKIEIAPIPEDTSMGGGIKLGLRLLDTTRRAQENFATVATQAAKDTLILQNADRTLKTIGEEEKAGNFGRPIEQLLDEITPEFAIPTGVDGKKLVNEWGKEIGRSALSGDEKVEDILKKALESIENGVFPKLEPYTAGSTAIFGAILPQLRNRNFIARTENFEAANSDPIIKTNLSVFVEGVNNQTLTPGSNEADYIHDQNLLNEGARLAAVNAVDPPPPFTFPDFETNITQEDQFIVNQLQQKFNPEDFGLPERISPRELRLILSKDSMKSFVRLTRSRNPTEQQQGRNGLRLITLLLGTAYENASGGPLQALTGFVDRMTEANVPPEVIDTIRLIYHVSALDYAAIESQDSAKDYIEIYEKLAGPNDDKYRQTIDQRAAALHGNAENNFTPYLVEARNLFNWLNSPKIMFQLMQASKDRSLGPSKKDPYTWLEDKLTEFTNTGRITNLDINGNEIRNLTRGLSRGEIKLSINVVKNLWISSGGKEFWIKRTIVKTDTVQNGETISAYRVLRPGEREPRGPNMTIAKEPGWFVSNPHRALSDFRAFATGVKKRFSDIFPGKIEDHPEDAPVHYYEKELNYDGRLYKSDGEQVLELAYFGETTTLNTAPDTTPKRDGTEKPMRWLGRQNPTVTEVMASSNPNCKVDPMKQWKFMKKWNNALAIALGITESLPPKLTDVLEKAGVPIFEYEVTAGAPDDKEKAWQSIRQMQIAVPRFLRLFLAHYQTEGYPVDRQDLTNEMSREQDKRNMWINDTYNAEGKALFRELDVMAQKANVKASAKKRDGAKRPNVLQYIDSVVKAVGVKIG